MAETELFELCGSVENIIFRNERNQYAVIEVLSGDELITAVGTFPYISLGEELKIIGTWTSHPSFGTQFKADTFEKSAPKTTAAMLKYLSGGAIKGIGPATAARIISAFGENTLEVIENEPERLAQVKGISKAKAREISEEVKKIYGIRELMLFLGEYGVKPDEAVRVWKSFGADSRELIGENPYSICSEYINIDFAVADAIARSFDKPQEHLGRITAGVMYVLRHNNNNGHTCLPADKLAVTSAKMLGVNLEYVQDILTDMCENFVVLCREVNGRDCIFLPNMYKAENFAAERLALMMRYPPQSIGGVDFEIDEIEAREKIKYADKQRDAIKAALEKGLLILTGGPGTGKTTTLNCIIRLLKNKGETVFLAAPTGRAAKRMSELTGEEAKTIHRMLQVDWDENDNPIFVKNESNPLNCDTVVIDELSMVDTTVFEGVLHALPLGCRLILVGDSDQLPSVGPGNIIGDLINSGYFPTVQLKEIFRQSMESLIVTNAHKIVGGEYPVLDVKNNDFFFMGNEDRFSTSETILALCSTRLPNTYGYSPVNDIQVLCPGRKGELGTVNLNKLLRDTINPQNKAKKQTEINGTVFREGDKVMQIRNDYNLPWVKEDGTGGEGVFNGDMGVISEIDKASGIIRVDVDDKEVIYDFEKVATELEHAYAVTVHKSQGNEFSAVIMPLFNSAPQLCYRNLLYTGITRAKEMLIIIGQKSQLYKMIDNDKKTRRFTGLPQFLVDEFTAKAEVEI